MVDRASAPRKTHRDPPVLRLDRRHGGARRARRADAVLGAPDGARPAPARDDARRARGRVRPRSPDARTSRSSSRSSIASCAARSRRCASATASPCCDLLGPPLEALGQAAGHEADLVVRAARSRSTPTTSGASPRWSSSSSTTTASPARGSTEADIVLVGVSRTGKTPLSMYLGYLGLQDRERPARARHRAAGAPVRDRGRAGSSGSRSTPSGWRASAAGACARSGRARATATPSSSGSWPSSTRRRPSIDGSAAPCSTSRASRSRRPPSASSSWSRRGVRA